MLNESQLKELLNTHRDKLRVLVEALETLAPTNFAENTGQQNLSNYVEFVKKHSTHFPDVFSVRDTEGTVEQLIKKGLCPLYASLLDASDFQENFREHLECELDAWWYEKYPHHSCYSMYPIEPACGHSPEEAYRTYEELWLTDKDVEAAELDESGMRDLHVAYCERRYQLVQCTVDYFRHLLTLQN